MSRADRYAASARSNAAETRRLLEWVREKQACAPHSRMLSTRTRRKGKRQAPAATASPDPATYESIFREAPYADIPEAASIFGPGAYFMDLMEIVQREVTAWYPDLDARALGSRRPDLWNLLLTPENATDMVSNADLVREVLESVVARLGPSAPAFPPAALPPAAPGSFVVATSWPATVLAATTYAVDAASSPLTPGAVPVTASATIRSARWVQDVTIGDTPLTVGAAGESDSPEITIEGFSFTFSAGATAVSLLQYTGGLVTLRNCVFSAAGGAVGWAISCAAKGTPSGALRLENCTFVDNGDMGAGSAIDTTAAGPLALDVRDTLLWASGAIGASYTAISASERTAVSLDFCDVRGGATSVSGGRVDFGSANFDADPMFAASTPSYVQLQASSPGIGRGSRGNDVGAAADLYSLVAWGIYPFELPRDIEAEVGRMALDAAGTSLDEIDVALSAVPASPHQSIYYALSELGLSLADYVLLSVPRSNGVEPYYGLTSFDTEAVKLAPASPAGRWVFQALDFAERIGLSLDLLRDLVYQDLSQAEIAAGIHAGGDPLTEGWAGFWVNGLGDRACSPLALLTQYVPVGRFGPEFTGTTSCSIEFPALQSPPTGSFTVSLWILPTAGGAATILEVGSDASAARWQFSAAEELEVVLGASSLAVDIGAFVTPPQWFQVTTAFDERAGMLSVYINGEPAGTTAVSAFTWPSGTMTLGTGASGGAFAGSLGDLTIWDFALTADDVGSGLQHPAMEQQAAAGCVAPTGLRAFWPLNDDAPTIVDWANPGPNNGKASDGLAFGQVGLPPHVVAAGSLPTIDGLDFVQAELLTTSDSGLSASNLDRISDFVRLASRLGWSFSDLDWALFTLGQLKGVGAGLTDDLFTELAALSSVHEELELPLQQVCALFGPIRPFGQGRLGDALSLFDQIFNSPPLAAPPFSPGMSLTLSIASDFASPGPVVRRLAGALEAPVEDVATLARNLASGDAVKLNASTLSSFYSLRLLAATMDVDVQSLLRLLEFTSLPLGSRRPSQVREFLRTMQWIESASLDPVDLHVLVPPVTTSVPDPFDQKFELKLREALPKVTTRLGQGLSACRVGPTSFVDPEVDEVQSAVMYSQQVDAGLIDGATGLITSTLWASLPVAPYVVPSIEYPTIGDAVKAAEAALDSGASDATVLIAPGTYDTAGNFGLSVRLQSGTLTLQAQATAEATVVDCQGSRFLDIEQGGTGSVVINGLTVQNGDSAAVEGGGAIYSTCPLTLVGCGFRSNRSSSAGGALAIAGTQSAQVALNLENCLFHDNKATSGGGALSLVFTGAEVSFCTFYANTSAQNLGNGFLLDESSTLALDGSIAWDYPDGEHDDWAGGLNVTYFYSDVNRPVPPEGEPTRPGDEPSGTGCVYTDPLLVAPANGLFQPGTGSPCIRTGPHRQNMGYGGGAGSATALLRLYPFAYAQIGALGEALGDLFEDDSLPLATVLDVLGPQQNGLEILVPECDAARATDYLRQLYRYVLMAYVFRLDGKLLALVLADPGLFSLQASTGLYAPDADDVRTLTAFTALRERYPDAGDDLVRYLRASSAGSASPPPASALASIFGWSADDVDALLGSGSGSGTAVTLGGALAIARAIDLSERSGLDGTLLLSLYRDGLVFGSGGARPLLDAVAAEDADAAASVSAVVTDIKRETLKRFAIPLIDAVTRPQGFPVANEDDLSEYLLMDVEMGVQTSTSRLVQAMLSVQQYIQRCRLGLEPGVGAIGIGDREWNWISSYRTWQANRKVFVHPEDYVRPELRKDKTPLFVDLERSLANTPMTKDGLERLFKRYVDGFLTMASLETVGSWFEPAERIATSVVVDSTIAAAGVAAIPAGAESPQFPQLSVEAWIENPSGAWSKDLNFLGIGSPDGSTYSLRIFSAATTRQLTIEISDSGANVLSVKAPVGALQPGEWSHVCVVLGPAPAAGSAMLTLYVNGAAVGTPAGGPFGSFRIANGQGMLFGQAGRSQPAVTIGLADVRLWTVARSAEQVAARVGQTVSLGDPDFAHLGGYWTFQNETLHDRTGEWRPGTVTGDVSYGVPETGPSADGSVVVDTWHFVGRTATPPFSYYHRTKRVCSYTGASQPAGDTPVWSPWEPIDATIPQRFASAVVMDGRLHVFWVEHREAPADSSAEPSTSKEERLQIKYTRRNADGTWTAAQAPFPELLLPAGADYDDPIWRKPYVIPMVYAGQTSILVIHGDVTATEAGAPWCFVLQYNDKVASLSLSQEAFGGTSYSTIACLSTTTASSLEARRMTSILGANSFELEQTGSVTTGSAVVEVAGGHILVYPANQLPLGVSSSLGPDPALFGTSAAAVCADGENYLLNGTGQDTNILQSSNIMDPSGWTMLGNSLLPAGMNQMQPKSVLAWNGSLYCAFLRWTTNDLTSEIIIATAPIGACSAPWEVYGKITSMYLTFPFLQVLDDETLCCVYVEVDTTTHKSRPCLQSWRNGTPGSPTPLDLQGLQGDTLTIASPVLVDGTWYLLGYSATEKAMGPYLFQAPDLVGPWTDTKNAPLVGQIERGYTLQLAAAGSTGLLAGFDPFPSFFAPAPTASWAAVDLPAGLPATSPGVSLSIEFSAQILGLVDPSSPGIPVTNQLGAYTMTSGANGFLVRASRPPHDWIDAQVRASLRAPTATTATATVELEGTDTPDLTLADFIFERLTTSVGPLLAEALAIDGIDGLMSMGSQRAAEFDFASLLPQANVAQPIDSGQVSFSLSDAFGVYFRELFFFVPWLIAERLSANRQFLDARTYYEYIFKPSDAASGEDYWRSAWLATEATEPAIEALEELDPAALVAYREDPFDAGAIADLRPVAYQRAIVTGYIKNLIAWGDDQFAADTRESINEAAELYRFAGDLLGPRPRHVAYTPPPPETYGDLRLQMRNEFLLTLDEGGSDDGANRPTPLLPGSEPNGSVAALGFYFGLPDSPDFLANWDLVEDRLEKIRNGLDLSGVVDDLPLFEPPLSIADIQRLGAQGGTGLVGGAGGLADSASESEGHFLDLLYSARALANTVMDFGGSLLRALEMSDAEALAEMQLGQQSVISDRLRGMRAQEVDNAAANEAMATSALQAASYRREFYKGLLDGGWSQPEKTGVALSEASLVPRAESAIANVIAGPAYLVPTLFGVVTGGGSLGGALQAGAAAAGDIATMLSESASLSNVIGSYERRAEEWAYQQRLAEFDVAQLNHQLSIATRQLSSSQLQYALENTTFEQMEAVQGYYSSKFTSAELYTWLSGTLGGLHQQLYQITLGMAQMAQATLTALTGADHQLLSVGGWDSQRHGLLAGESLVVDLARLEQAYREWQGSAGTQVSTKRVSLRTIDPAAYLQLVSTGSCTFRLPQELFDRDLPGHYLRTITGLSVTVPGIEEHRHDVFGTLICLSHETVRQPDVAATRFLLGAPERMPGAALRRNVHARRAVLSHGEDANASVDEFSSGDLDAFVGVGAVSTWRLDLPESQSRVDPVEIDDVVLSLTYTSRYGGEPYQARVEKEVPQHRGALLIDVAQDFPSEWAKARAQLGSDGQAAMRLALRPDMLPRALPGNRFDLVALQIGARDGLAPQCAGERLVVEAPDGPSRTVELDALPSVAGSVFAAALPAPIPGLPDQRWIIDLSGTGSADPHGIWILAEYEETDQAAGDREV